MNKARKYLSLISILTVLLTASSSGAIEKFEKGDILYRGPWAPGHAALYYRWLTNLDPDVRSSHRIIEAVPDGGVHLESLDVLYVGQFMGAKTAPGITYVQRKVIIQSALRELGDGFFELLPWSISPETWTWGDKGPNTWSCVGLTENCYECAGLDPVKWDRVPSQDPKYEYVKGWLCPERQYDSENLVSSSGIFYYLTFHKSGIIEVGEAITPKIKYEDGKYYIKNKVNINFYASDGSVGSGLTRAELWLGLPDDTPGLLPGKRIYKDDSNHDVDHLYTCSFNTTTVENKEYTLYAKAFDQAGNYATTSVPVVIENVAAIEKIFSWQGYDLKLTFSRDTQGPVYIISYKERSEDTTWTKWGEYDTKDTGGTGDIILNLNLEGKIKEYESEEDDAGRLTHECKLTATGKDVFKEYHGYKTERLIVDTTAAWSAGELDGITVVDEVHPVGGMKKGYIKPYFGDKYSLSTYAPPTPDYTISREYISWIHEFNCPQHGKGNCPGWNGDPSHDSALRDWLYTGWYWSPGGSGDEVFIYVYFSSTLHIEKPFYENQVWYYMPLGAKFAGGTYGFRLRNLIGSGVVFTAKLSDFSVSVPSTDWITGEVPSSVEGEVVGDEVRFYFNRDPGFDVPYFSWDSLVNWGDGRALGGKIAGSFNVYYIKTDKGIWSRVFSDVTSDKYENPEMPTDATQGKNSIIGEWDDEGKWKVTIDFPYEETPTTWFDRFRYDFKEKKTPANPA